MSSARITRLLNGVKVITQTSTESHFCSAGILIDAGSRFENDVTKGSSHLLDKLTLQSTIKYTKPSLVQKLENIGGQFQCVSSRELIMYQAMIFHKDLDTLMDLMGQIVRHPLLKDEEVEEAKTAAMYDVLDSKWDPLTTLPEKLHAIAFRDHSTLSSSPLLKLDTLNVQTLGRSQKVNIDCLDLLDAHKIRQFRETLFTPDRIVVSGVNVDHDEMVRLAEREFGDMHAASSSILQAQREVTIPAKYTGGTAILDTSNLPSSPNPDDMILTNLHIVFEAMSMRDPDIYALSTLASLLGGGGSFSAGGPGKGMYTRLYTQVLNRNGWVENCNVINNTYKDTSLFGISMAVCSDDATHHHIASVICDQIVNCTTACTKTELDRAKNQLKSNLLMSLESQLVQLEDMGRQALAYGKRMDVQEMCRRIDLVSQSDVIRVGRRVFLGERIPSVFDFKDDFCKAWEPTGPWRPTVLVEGPLTGKKDSLWNIEESISKWGLSSPSPTVQGRKR